MNNISEIIRLCLDDNQKGYELFFKKYYSYLYKICYIYLQDNQSSKDLLQEIFIKIFKKLNEYDHQQGPIEFWLRKIAVNMAIDCIRAKNRKIKFISENVESLQPTILNGALSKLELHEVFDLIENLKHPLREVIILYTIEGYSHKEISEILSISEEYSRLLLFESRKIIKNYFKNEKEIYGKEC